MEQSSNAKTLYVRAPVWSAAISLLFCPERYLKYAVKHYLAINLEAPDLAIKHQAGLFPLAGWEVGAEADARKGLEEIRSALVSAFAKMVGLILIAVLVLWLFGRISPDMPWDWSKVLSFVGAFLAAWATVFELGGIWRSWEGNALHELVHPKIFQLLFVPGSFLATLGLLW